MKKKVESMAPRSRRGGSSQDRPVPIECGPALYRALVEGSPDAIVVADREGLIRFWNAGAEATFGHTAAETMGRSLDIIIPENLRKRHWTRIRRRNGQRRDPIRHRAPEGPCSPPKRAPAIDRVSSRAAAKRPRPRHRHCGLLTRRDSGLEGTARVARTPGCTRAPRSDVNVARWQAKRIAWRFSGPIGLISGHG